MLRAEFRCVTHCCLQSLKQLASIYLSPDIEHIDFGRFKDTTVLYTIFPNLLEEYWSMSYGNQVKAATC